MNTSLPRRHPKYVQTVTVSVGIVLSVLGLWANRYLVSPDGISYLDYSDHFLDGSWRSMANGYWSPGYPFMIAIVRSLIGSTPDHDILALHLAVSIGFAVSVFAFSVLLHSLLGAVRGVANGTPALISDLIVTLGWMTFFWSSVSTTVLFVVTPDAWVSACTYLATALLIKTFLEPARLLPALGLGVVLAAGYLFKGVMFPVGLLMLGTLVVLQLYRKASLRAALLSAVTFLLLAAPQVITQSRLKGSPSIGQVGPLAYAWYAGGVPCPLWPPEANCMTAPEGVDDPMAVQPFPRLTDHPSVFFFPKLQTATFPVWYDASSWYTNVHPRLSLRAQFRATKPNLVAQWALIAPFLIAAVAWILTVGRGLNPPGMVNALLIVPSVGTLVMYALTYSEARYLGPSVTLLVLGVACTSRTRSTTQSHVGFFLGSALLGASMVLLLGTSISTFDQAWWSRHQTDEVRRSAQDLVASGLPTTSRIGIIGNGYEAYWARLNRMHIIAEVHQSEARSFWDSGSDVQQKTLNAFRATGAIAVVSDPSPAVLPPGWQRARPDSKLAVYRLQR